jgi:hypothetical protein
VEAKFGIHEGTYKVFVNFRAAADITYMPTDIYSRVFNDSAVIGGIHYAGVDFLRMNMYVELSRPAGNVSRWEKVYERLLLLNAEHPMKSGRCAPGKRTTTSEGKKGKEHNRVIKAGIEAGAIFLGDPEESPILLMSDKASNLVTSMAPLVPTHIDAIGELLPARTELRKQDDELVAVVFETVACHSYRTHPDMKDYRLGSLDLLIEIYYAMYFAEVTHYKKRRLLCLIHELIEEEHTNRVRAVEKGLPAHDVFLLDCIGHQPSMPELKKAHRDRVRDKKNELMGALRIGPRHSRKQRQRQKQTQ